MTWVDKDGSAGQRLGRMKHRGLWSQIGGCPGAQDRAGHERNGTVMGKGDTGTAGAEAGGETERDTVLRL